MNKYGKYEKWRSLIGYIPSLYNPLPKFKPQNLNYSDYNDIQLRKNKRRYKRIEASINFNFEFVRGGPEKKTVDNLEIERIIMTGFEIFETCACVVYCGNTLFLFNRNSWRIKRLLWIHFHLLFIVLLIFLLLFNIILFKKKIR